MNNYKVKVIYREDIDSTSQTITEYTIQAKNKIQAVDMAAKKAKQEIPDYSDIRHDLFYDAIEI